MQFLYQFFIERYSRSISQYGISATTWAERCFPIIYGRLYYIILHLCRAKNLLAIKACTT